MSFLEKDRCVAGAGYSRWMVPPAALCIHLCIGQVYALSVFNLPMTQLIGIGESSESDWKLTEIGWIFSIAIFFLGLSASIFGRWVEEGGPRRAMFTSALVWRFFCFCSRCSTPPTLARLPWVRSTGWNRSWPRLHLTGFYTDQVVP